MEWMNDLQHFWDFMKRRHEAAVEYVSGNALPTNELSTTEFPSTLFAMTGGVERGHERVAVKYFKTAQDWEVGGDSRFEIVQLYATKGIGYWVGYQHVTIWKRDRDEAEPVTMRVTEIYRRKGSDWKLVHRHSDPLAEDTSDPPGSEN